MCKQCKQIARECKECKEFESMRIQRRTSESYIIHVFENDSRFEVNRVMFKLYDMPNAERDSILAIAGFTCTALQRYINPDKFHFEVFQIQKLIVCVPLKHHAIASFERDSDRIVEYRLC